MFKASIEQNLETFEQTKNTNIPGNEKAVKKTEKKETPVLPVKEYKTVTDESFTDDMQTYEENSNLMIQVLTVIQNLTKRNKAVVKLLKKNNILDSLNQILLIENLTKLVCNILENLLHSSIGKYR